MVGGALKSVPMTQALQELMKKDLLSKNESVNIKVANFKRSIDKSDKKPKMPF